MEEYKPTKQEVMRMRKEKVRHAKDLIRSLNTGMGKFERGSNVEGNYMEEKIDKLNKLIKNMQGDMGF